MAAGEVRPLRIYWIRHGEMESARLRDQFRTTKGGPDLALLNRVLGQEEEGPLSGKGRQEAEAAAQVLARRPIKSVWSSTMIRARETAEALAGITGHEITVTDDLREVRAGKLSEDDLTWRFIRGVTGAPLLPDSVKVLVLGATVIPTMYYRWERGLTRGGETPAEFHARLTRAVSGIIKSHDPGDSIAVFCHGYVITYLADRFCRTGPPVRVTRYVRNGSITTTDVRPDGSLVLREFAAARHLKVR